MNPQIEQIQPDIFSKLASEPYPGYFGLFYRMNKPTKNAKEAGLSEKARDKVKGLKDWQILQKTFDAMK